MTSIQDKVELLENELRSCSSNNYALIKLCSDALSDNLNKIYFACWVMSITILIVLLYLFSFFSYQDEEGIHRTSIIKLGCWSIILTLLSAGIGYTCILSLN